MGKLRVPVRILLINHYAGSPEHGMEFRPYYLAREWVRSGHDVIILAASFSHLRQHNPETGGHPLQEEWRDGIRYLWFRTPPYSGNGPRRVLNMAAFMKRLLFDAAPPVREFRPDLVIASSTYTWDNYAAARFAAWSNARYVFEVHDLWPLTPMELGGMSHWHPFVLALQRAEDFACRRADVIISLLPHADRHLRKRGMPEDRFAHIPNGVALDEWKRKEPAPEHVVGLTRRLRRDGHFVVGYVGGHGVSNGLEFLVEAAGTLVEQSVTIVCVGHGPEKERLKRLARERNAPIHFLAPVPKRCVPAVLGCMDALYLGWRRSPLYRFGICPNKLLDYMMAGKPVIHAIEAANDLVAESGCGVSVPPEDPAAVKRAVLHLKQLPLPQRNAMGQRGHAYVVANHDYRTLAERFLQVAMPAGNSRQTESETV